MSSVHMMLRSSIAPSGRLLCSPVRQRSGSQWLVNAARARPGSVSKRYYARTTRAIYATVRPSAFNASIVIRKSTFSTTTAVQQKDVRSPPSPSDNSSISPEKVPNPPRSPSSQTQKSSGSSVPPPPPERPTAATTTTTTTSSAQRPQPPPSPSSSSSPPATPKPKSSRFRRYLVYLFLATGVAYVGGVWLSLKSDNFHDFFTEYVPYGEEAVLYLEEWDFRRRFPNATRQMNRRPSEGRPLDDGQQVVISGKSGMSWKTSEEEQQQGGSDVSRKGKHMSAIEANNAAQEQAEKPKPKPQPKVAEAPAAESKKVKEGVPKKQEKAAERRELAAPAKPAEPERKPTLEEPLQPLTQTVTVEKLAAPDSADPAVKELVRIVNDLITVSHAGNAGGQLSAPLEKAKAEFLKLADDITNVRTDAKTEAQAEIAKAHEQFDQLATELVRRIDQVRTEESAQFREEFEAEREKIVHAYQEKINTELERANQVAEQRMRNELMEQAIELNRNFLADVRELVEREREGRLSKLSELQEGVSQLGKLTADWSSVVDANLKSQQLQVAIDAAYAALDESDVPRPFIKELVAIKEIAGSDPVVCAAVSSISPVAYQRGIPSQAQLVDRFRRVASEVRKASLLPENAGITSHIASVVLSKATFKKQISSNPDDVESVLTRTENLLEEGNFDEAAREMNSLRGWARLLSKDWLADVRRVLEVKQALDIIETEARLRCLQLA